MSKPEDNKTPANEGMYPCPRCGEPVDWKRNPRWKPFCSERCKMIDLGAWFSEEHAIPGDPVPGDSPPDDSTGENV